MKKLLIVAATIALMGQGCLSPEPTITTQPPIAQPNPTPAPTPMPYNY